MTCIGCDRDVTLMDGYYCGRCTSDIGSAVKRALADLDGVKVENPEIHDVFVDEDGLLTIRVDTGRDGGFDERIDELIEREKEALDALAE